MGHSSRSLIRIEPRPEPAACCVAARRTPATRHDRRGSPQVRHYAGQIWSQPEASTRGGHITHIETGGAPQIARGTAFAAGVAVAWNTGAQACFAAHEPKRVLARHARMPRAYKFSVTSRSGPRLGAWRSGACVIAHAGATRIPCQRHQSAYDGLVRTAAIERVQTRRRSTQAHPASQSVVRSTTQLHRHRDGLLPCSSRLPGSVPCPAIGAATALVCPHAGVHTTAHLHACAHGEENHACVARLRCTGCPTASSSGCHSRVAITRCTLRARRHS